MNQQMRRSAPGLRIAMLSIHSSPIGPLGTRDTGGMSVYVRELSRHLGHYGHRVDIFTYDHGNDQFLFPNVKLIHLAPQPARLPGKEALPAYLPEVFGALESYRQSRRQSYDLIHSHYWLSGVVGAMAQARWHRPHVIMFHTLAKVKIHSHSEENESDLRIAHEKWLAKATDYILVPTAREKNNLMAYYHAHPSKIGIVPCGVDLDLFKPMDRSLARQTLGLPPDAPLLLFVGRFAVLKGLNYLVRATAELRLHYPDLELLIAGGDGPNAPATQHLSELADELDVSQRIRFLGRLDQNLLPLYYNSADVLVLPSHYESFGMVILEALACGTRVAATAVGVADDVLQTGVNGAIISAPDYHAVVGAVSGILDQQRDRSLNRESIRAAVKRFNWRQIADATADVYSDMMAAHGVCPDHLRIESGG